MLRQAVRQIHGEHFGKLDGFPGAFRRADAAPFARFSGNLYPIRFCDRPIGTDSKTCQASDTTAGIDFRLVCDTEC